MGGFSRADLKDLDKVWKDSASTGADTEAEVPEGKYQAKIKAVELGKSSGGRPQCKFVFKVVGGSVEEAIGKELTTYDGLESPMNMGYFKKKLRRLQLRMPESFEEIEEIVAKAVGAVVEIQVKIKDEFVNVYVNKLVTPGAETSSGDEEEKPAKPAKEPAKGKGGDDEDEKPAKGGDDDEDEKPSKSDDEDEAPKGGDDEDEDKGGPASRGFPLQAEIDKMPKDGLLKLLKEFKIKGVEGKKEEFQRGVAKTLVAVMEDDDYDMEERFLSAAAKWLGLTPEEGKKKLLQQIIKHLGG